MSVFARGEVPFFVARMLYTVLSRTAPYSPERGNMNGLARDGITHSGQGLFNVLGGAFHGSCLVGVAFPDGVRQLEHMRSQTLFRLFRVRNIAGAAGLEQPGATGEGQEEGHDGQDRKKAQREKKGPVHKGGSD